MKLIWAPEALGDLDDIYDFYAPKSQRAAAILYNAILDEVEILRNQPYIAAVDPLLQDNPKTYRAFLAYKLKFKVLYYVQDDEIHIMGVLNCRQNPERIKKRLS